MLSAKLVYLIETNWQEISTRVCRSVQTHPDMQVLAKRPTADVRDWCQEMLENLGRLLSANQEQEVARRFEVLGKLRFEEHVPLHEAVLRVHILRRTIAGFVHEQAYPVTGLQLYAQQELEERMAEFFDACVYHIVRGYEGPMRRATRLAS